jgi:Erv1 / Alr family
MSRKTISAIHSHENNGMMTSIWGPSAWHFLHTVSFNYPINPSNAQKKIYRTFVLNFQNILPCGKCRKNLTNNFKSLPLKMKFMNSRETFSKYVYDLHNVVNKMLGKKKSDCSLTYDDVRERYENFRARCGPGGRDHKGCTTPKRGKTKKKCILKVVHAKSTDEKHDLDGF